MYAYVGSRTTRERNARGDGINVYRVDADTGTWGHVQLIDDLVNPSFLALDRKRGRLYAVHGDRSEVSAFRIDRGTGRLTRLNMQATQGRNPVHLTTDPTDRCLVLANHSTGTVAVLPIDDEGAIQPVSDLVVLAGTPGPHAKEQGYARPHQVAYDPTDRWILVPDKGLDQIFVFSVDAANGKLAPSSASSVATRESAGPRHVAFHPGGAWAYVLNELDSTVTMYSFDAARGALDPKQIVSSLPETFTGNSRAAEIVVHPAGRFLYASNRGHDSIAIFSINSKTGMLKAAGWAASGGKTPRFFAIDPAGKHLYAANEDSDTIVAFLIDASTGALEPTGHVIQTGSPVCIVFLH